MARSHAVLLKIASLRAYGDVGPFTVYTRKNGDMVWYKRSPPDKPGSVAQLHQRGRFTAAMLDWRQSTQEDRDIWESISLATSVPYTGLNLFMMMEMRPDMRTEIQSYAREAGYPDTPPFKER